MRGVSSVTERPTDQGDIHSPKAQGGVAGSQDIDGDSADLGDDRVRMTGKPEGRRSRWSRKGEGSKCSR